VSILERGRFQKTSLFQLQKFITKRARAPKYEKKSGLDAAAAYLVKKID